MSNYTIITNFLSKDALVSGNPAKLVKGADFTTEFTAIQAALNSKADGSVQFFPDGSAGQPSVGFSSIVGTGMYNAAGALDFATNSLQRISIATTGAITIAAPTSGTALTVNGNVVVAAPASGVALLATGVATQVAAQFNGASTSGQSYGAYIAAGTTSADFALLVRNQSAGSNFLEVFGDGGVVVGPPTGGDQGLGTLNAVNLLVNGVAVNPFGVPAIKTITGADNSRTSTTTLTNDATLSYAIPGAGTYRIRAVVWVASGSGGVAFNLNFSGSTSSSVVNYGSSFAGSSFFGNAISTTVNNPQVSAVSTQANGNVLVEAVVTATGAGTLAVAWAQASSNAAATLFKVGSNMTVERIA